MIFNSIVFLIFFIVFYFLYWNRKIQNRLVLRNLFIIIASYLFYGWWDPRFLSLIFISSITDYYLAIVIQTTKAQKKRKLYLIISLFINLGMLGFFKYYNFFVDSLIHSLSILGIEANIHSLNIILPVGISFYTFQTLSYTIDIYYKRMPATKDIFAFLAFVSFFPQLVAGPIERAKNLLPQFFSSKELQYKNQIEGLRYILYGLFKKIVLADSFASISDLIFSDVETYHGAYILMGAFAFAIQIYCDFSGYSDMAIGLSKMLGFDLMQNFATPYFSSSFTEFWQRWHISLSSWFRDYVYIPLGGNKKGPIRRNINIIITFVLSGLWHGAKLTFVIWGLLHGLMLVIEKHVPTLRGFNLLKVLLVFLLTCLLWMPFRALDMAHLLKMFSHLISFETTFPTHLLQLFDAKKWIILILLLISFIYFEIRIKNKNIQEFIANIPFYYRYTAYYLWFLSILYFTNLESKPFFIYFQF